MRWPRRPGSGAGEVDSGRGTAAEPAAPAPDDPLSAGSATADRWERDDDTAPGTSLPPPVAFHVDPDDVQRATSRAVARALAEDLGIAGDVTSQATISPGMRGTGDLVARADGTVAGTAAVVETYAQVDRRVVVRLEVQDGTRVAAGDLIARVEGPLRSILTGERTALNLLCHLSGVATATRRLVDALESTGCTIRDTRKTTPGLRLLEKAAVVAGGGANHRIGLHDALLVKDNHIAAAGGVTAATTAALARAGELPVQVEVTSLTELDEAIEAGATDILLDNVDPDLARRAVAVASGRARLEASGRLDLSTARAFADAGVDRVAVGAITHSAPALDVALDLVDDDVTAEPEAAVMWEDELLFADRPGRSDAGAGDPTVGR